MTPFSTRPEDFGQRFISRPSFRYMPAAEFDEITGNPTPLGNILGPDTEVLFIEAQDLKRPENAPKRTFITGDTSPVGKWARWVQSWQDHGREFNGEHPESHDGEYMWLALRQVSMGKRGTHEVWTYDGVPSPEEIAALPSGSTEPQPAPATSVASTATAAAPGPDSDTVRDAILLVAADGITPLALYAAVNEMVMADVPRGNVLEARDTLIAEEKLRSEGGKLYATQA